MKVTVRAVTRSDSAAVVELVRQLNLHQGDPTEHFTETTLERDVFGPEAYLEAIVAEHGGELVGYAFSHDGYDSGWAARGIYLCDLFVVPHARRLGVGRALVAAAARRARERGRSFCGGLRMPGTTMRSDSMRRSRSRATTSLRMR